MKAATLLRAAAVTAACALLLGASPLPPTAAEIETAAAAGVARPFGSHPVAYPAGAAVAPGGVAAADAATAAAYDR
ncbi:hypothetical protein, partial [Herbiconiux sp.]|uniref:hypothetical protein n=1 Tax=Herbiconiux sp. TaxID=1871186 RepID=UPI0025C37418